MTHLCVHVSPMAVWFCDSPHVSPIIVAVWFCDSPDEMTLFCHDTSILRFNTKIMFADINLTCMGDPFCDCFVLFTIHKFWPTCILVTEGIAFWRLAIPLKMLRILLNIPHKLIALPSCSAPSKVFTLTYISLLKVKVLGYSLYPVILLCWLHKLPKIIGPVHSWFHLNSPVSIQPGCSLTCLINWQCPHCSHCTFFGWYEGAVEIDLPKAYTLTDLARI